MKSSFLILAAALALLTAACERTSNSAQTADAAPTVRLPLAAGRPGVAYLSLPVEGDRGALVSVTSPRIGRIEMHETMRSGTMSSMRPLARLPVRSGEELAFVPGGRHLMLFELDPALRPGDRVDLVFNFERGAPQTVAATVTTAIEDGGH